MGGGKVGRIPPSEGRVGLLGTRAGCCFLGIQAGEDPSLRLCVDTAREMASAAVDGERPLPPRESPTHSCLARGAWVRVHGRARAMGRKGTRGDSLADARHLPTRGTVASKGDGTKHVVCLVWPNSMESTDGYEKWGKRVEDLGHRCCTGCFREKDYPDGRIRKRCMNCLPMRFRNAHVRLCIFVLGVRELRFCIMFRVKRMRPSLETRWLVHAHALWWTLLHKDQRDTLLGRSCSFPFQRAYFM
eukprot:scaffold24_cov341-Pavlova_lutheri.AAC.60